MSNQIGVTLLLIRSLIITEWLQLKLKLMKKLNIKKLNAGLFTAKHFITWLSISKRRNLVYYGIYLSIIIHWFAYEKKKIDLPRTRIVGIFYIAISFEILWRYCDIVVEFHGLFAGSAPSCSSSESARKLTTSVSSFLLLHGSCFHGSSSRPVCSTSSYTAQHNWSLSESQYCSTTISLCQVIATISSYCEVHNDIDSGHRFAMFCCCFIMLNISETAYRGLGAGFGLGTLGLQSEPVSTPPLSLYHLCRPGTFLFHSFIHNNL